VSDVFIVWSNFITSDSYFDKKDKWRSITTMATSPSAMSHLACVYSSPTLALQPCPALNCIQRDWYQVTGEIQPYSCGNVILHVRILQLCLNSCFARAFRRVTDCLTTRGDFEE